MVRPQTIATKYSAYKDPEFIDLGVNILGGVAGIPSYNKPPEPLAEKPSLMS